MENKEELLYQIALTLIPNIGSVTAKKLLEKNPSAKTVFKEVPSFFEGISGIRKDTRKSIIENKDIALKRAEEELGFVDRFKINVLSFFSDDYPKKLKHCDDSPPVLYFKGSCNINNHKTIGIVGTRKATKYGKSCVSDFIEQIKDYEPIIVSGLAEGIDTSAHFSSIKNNVSTIGCLGHGLDKIYPSENRKIAEQMIEKGGLLTEFLSKAKPDRENFPKRNRIIAGLCDVLLVIESGKKGGSLITAEIANSYHRDVFAFPGRIDDLQSEGCNKLIFNNKAHAYTCFEDFIQLMGWKEKEPSSSKKNDSLLTNLTDEEKRLVAFLKEKERASFDEISLALNVSVSELSVTLFSLEINGVVKSLPGKNYSL